MYISKPNYVDIVFKQSKFGGFLVPSFSCFFGDHDHHHHDQRFEFERTTMLSPVSHHITQSPHGVTRTKLASLFIVYAYVASLLLLQLDFGSFRFNSVAEAGTMMLMRPCILSLPFFYSLLKRHNKFSFLYIHIRET